VLAAVEHQVFEQGCESRPARLLVLRAYVVPHVHRAMGALWSSCTSSVRPFFKSELRVRDVGNCRLQCRPSLRLATLSNAEGSLPQGMRGGKPGSLCLASNHQNYGWNGAGDTQNPPTHGATVDEE
jgi:hypothetical protein